MITLPSIPDDPSNAITLLVAVVLVGGSIIKAWMSRSTKSESPPPVLLAPRDREVLLDIRAQVREIRADLADCRCKATP